MEKIAKIIARISLKNKNYGIVNICSGKAINMKDLVLKLKNKFKINPLVSFIKMKQREYESENFYGCKKKLNKILKKS